MSHLIETLGITVGELVGATTVITTLIAGIAIFHEFGDSVIEMFI